MSSPTSPMSSFLLRLAASVRDVVSRGETVHLDTDDARELWIIQGFAWNSATYVRNLKKAPPIDPDGIDPTAPADCEVVQVTPSDFARGCLILAGSSEEAGQMAELVALAQGCIDPRDAVGPSPWIGSNAGAWLSWGLMVKELRRISPPVGLAEMLPHHSAMDRLIRGLAIKCQRQCAAMQDYLDNQPSGKTA